MPQLVQLRVLIVGARGLGMETAKNLALAGPSAITLHDEGEASIVDLGANFFLKPAAVGTRRAAAVIDQLKELNSDVEIKTSRQWYRAQGALYRRVLLGSHGGRACITDVRRVSS